MKQEKRRSVALIPFYKDKDEVFVLLQKRSAHAERLPGMFGFFGGGMNADESSEECLTREIKEELAIDIAAYSYFNHYEFFGRIVDVFIMEVSKDFLNTVQVQEGDYGRFFTEYEVTHEDKLILPDKVILKNFFGYIKRNDPYS